MYVGTIHDDDQGGTLIAPGKLAAASHFFLSFFHERFRPRGGIGIACGISVIAFCDAINQTRVRVELSEGNTSGRGIAFPLRLCFEFHSNLNVDTA